MPFRRLFGLWRLAKLDMDMHWSLQRQKQVEIIVRVEHILCIALQDIGV